MDLKKIAIVCDYKLLPNRVGGMDYFFWAFDAKCKENNIVVDWFFPNISDHGEYSKLNIITSNKDNIEYFFLENHSHKNYSYIITHFVEVCKPYFKKLKQKSNAKIIVVDHNPRPLKGYTLLKKIKKRIKGFLYSKYIDLFVGVSQYTVNEILNDFGNHLKNKTKVIYNGVIINDIIIRSNRNLKKPTFLIVSHLRKSKGIQDLILSVSELSNEIKSQIKIDIYGDGHYKQNLNSLIDRYKLHNVFHFKGNVANLKEVYCNYDYMLQPTHMECFSLSILESLAANVPVVTTNVGGNEEVITNLENGFIFRAKDTTALTTLITKIFQGDLTLTTNTRCLIEEKFSLEKMVENYFELLH